MAEEVGEKPLENIKTAVQQKARAESVPAPVRRYRTALFQGALIMAGIAFGGLTALVKTTPSFAIDLKITRTIQLVHLPAFAGLMSAVSWPGFPPQSGIIAVLIVVLIYGFGLYWEAVMAAVAAVASSGLNVAVKELIQRPRPASPLVEVFTKLQSYSFPSGHVMFYIGFFGFIWFLGYTLLKPSTKRTALLVILGELILWVGVSRIYLGEHWASDVLGSYLLGSLVLAGVIQVYRWGKPRFFAHQPVAPSERPKA